MTSQLHPEEDTQETQAQESSSERLLGGESGHELIEVMLDGRRFLVVGVATITGDAPGLIEDLLEKTNPDVVCVDLDPARAKALSDDSIWENLTIADVIREKLLTALILNLILAAYSRKYGELKGGMPGTELYEASQVALSKAIPVCYCDRDFNITYSRAWRSIKIVTKLKLFLTAVLRLVKYKKAESDDLQKASSNDLLTAFIHEVTQLEPTLSVPLVDERDQFTAGKIASGQGEMVLAFVGAGRVTQISDLLRRDESVDMASLESITKTALPKRIASFAIPILVVIALIYLSVSQGKGLVRENLMFWVLVNSVFTGIGAIIAGGHILAVLTAIVVAPFSPFIPAGPGTVAAVVQILVRPPLVKDFQTFPNDLSEIRRWRKNRILRVLLLMVLCGLGSIIGTLLGTSKIILSLFGSN